MKTGDIQLDNRVNNILDEIVLEKRREVGIIKKKRRSLKEKLSENRITLIAEIKKASPSKGIISPRFNPEQQLEKYIRAGAGAVSILTDQKFFQGSKEIMIDLRKKADLPLLRKDFIIDPIQVYESFFIGADVILLISTILDKVKLRELIDLTHSLGMEALVEVHDSNDLAKVLDTSAGVIGINNRDLSNFTVSLKNTASIVKELAIKNLREDYFIIAESGIKKPEDINYLEEIGVNGVLIGESLMKSRDPELKIKELFSRKL